MTCHDGAPGIDGVTFEAIEVQGVEALLEQLRDELIARTAPGWALKLSGKPLKQFASSEGFTVVREFVEVETRTLSTADRI